VNERREEIRTGEWTTFSTGRQHRTFLPAADRCPLCPTLDPEHPTEIPVPDFQVAVFDNRFPPLVADPPEPSLYATSAMPVAPAAGGAEVVVYSPDHTRALGDMPASRIERVIDVWADRYAELSTREDIAYVFIFENRGVEIGVTLHHPHGQIYAFPEIPPRPRLELDAALAHLARTERCVWCDVTALERGAGARMLIENESFAAFVPFAARFPYEAHIVSRRHVTSLVDVTTPERAALADVMRRLLRGYDYLFGFPMPYVMAMHQAPTSDAVPLAASHLHLEYLPPYRSADRLKYLAGAELGAGAFVNDTAPEETAAELREAIAAAS
jgi:UDPglucose--hexose-1-phosphate uridylyltransferase